MDADEATTRIQHLQRRIDAHVDSGGLQLTSGTYMIAYLEGALSELARAFPVPMPEDAVGIAAMDSGAYIGCRACTLESYDEGFQDEGGEEYGVGTAVRMGLVRFVYRDEAIREDLRCEACNRHLVPRVLVRLHDDAEVFEAVEVRRAPSGAIVPVFDAEALEEVLDVHGPHLRDATGRDPREDIRDAQHGFMLDGWTFTLDETEVTS